MSSRRRTVRLVAGGALAAAGLWLGLSLFVAHRLTRRSGVPVAEVPPASGPLDVHRIMTSDGEELGAWLLAPDALGPGVVLLHGNGGSRSAVLPKARFFAGEGCAVLAVSLRCHGDSTGTVNDLGRGAAQDVVAAVGLLEQERPGAPVVVVGSSLGAAAAVFAAGELGERVSGYVLECPYADLASAVRARTQLYLPPLLDELAFRGLLTVAPLVLEEPDGIAPIDHASAFPDVPVRVLAGARDAHAPLSEVRRLFERLGGAKELVVFDGAGHDRLFADDPVRYAATLRAFLEGVPRER